MKPFEIDIPDTAVASLRQRIADTRWPGELPGLGWSRGVPLDTLRGLADYWMAGFDWGAAQKQLNRLPQFVTTLDGATVHLVHARSSEPGATPLLLAHGWPGSFAEFLDVVDRLTDPVAHGGDPEDAFHVVIPSMPGHGFSSPLPGAGWGTERVARAWGTLMEQLGYERYLVQGGDVGSVVAQSMGRQFPSRVIGVHVSMLLTLPSGDPSELADLTPAELDALGALQRFDTDLSGYLKVQSTRPQTLAYAMDDSPVGSLAWQLEKFEEWSDPACRAAGALDRDRILTITSLYWFTGTAGSSTQFYFEDAALLPRTDGSGAPPPPPLTVPVAVAVSPKDIIRPVHRLAHRDLPTIVRWTEFESGGHFAAMEQPVALTEDIRSFARSLRGG